MLFQSVHVQGQVVQGDFHGEGGLEIILDASLPRSRDPPRVHLDGFQGTLEERLQVVVLRGEGREEKSLGGLDHLGQRGEDFPVKALDLVMRHHHQGRGIGIEMGLNQIRQRPTVRFRLVRGGGMPEEAHRGPLVPVREGVLPPHVFQREDSGGREVGSTGGVGVQDATQNQCSRRLSSVPIQYTTARFRILPFVRRAPNVRKSHET